MTIKNTPAIFRCAIALVATVLVSCAGVASSSGTVAGAPLEQTAQGTCLSHSQSASAYGGNAASLSGAFTVTASELAQWAETRHGPSGPQGESRWRSRPATETVSVCYFDGVFTGFPRIPPPPGATSPPPYDRIVLIVTNDGAITLDAAGYRTKLPVVRPSAQPRP